MNPQILDGKICSAEVRGELADEVRKCQRPPSLGIILVGNDPRSEVYVSHKLKAAKEVGIETHIIRCDSNISTADLLLVVGRYNRDVNMDAFIIQFPLPPHIDKEVIINSIDPLKDADCFHHANQGLLFQGTPRFVPATPRGVIELLRRYGHTTSGKRVVVVGHSLIVGRPLAAALLLEGPMGEATVTIAHIKTQDLPDVTRTAEILITATGKPGLIAREHVMPGAVVVDVGITKTEKGIVGDVDFEAVSAVASAITPVPGGVGPMTAVILLKNTLLAHQLCR